ncbi:hypothetical protein TSUD_02660 [Trifolium subterraneum]|uniref:Peptidase C1A papain C-terminal domain-containing protein n=1 Tax=Trifolium subterraneum TaxID=3900 RepID=A0A2Z6M2Q1_TRISU|nr:hypothetical protein TSUD_02660 [Trifolium subterraneum]
MNEMNKAAGKNYTLGLNDFSDLTAGEFTTSCAKSMKISNEAVSSKTVFLNMSVDIPESVDWREKGAVTSVKRQGECGACWAFATMAALEGLWQIKTNELISLSAQHLIDCDRESEGCAGGYLDTAIEFETTKSNGGVPKEEDYPYKEIQQACRNDVKPWASFDGYQFVPSGDEQQLLLAVAQQPVAALVAVGDEFEAFGGEGIYSGTCGSELNHAVAIVGYGVIVALRPVILFIPPLKIEIHYTPQYSSAVVILVTPSQLVVPVDFPAQQQWQLKYLRQPDQFYFNYLKPAINNSRSIIQDLVNAQHLDEISIVNNATIVAVIVLQHTAWCFSEGKSNKGDVVIMLH